MKQLPFSFQLLNFKQQKTFTMQSYTIWLVLNGSLKISTNGSQTLNRKDIIFFDMGTQVSVAPPYDNSILALSLEPEQFCENIGTANPMIMCNSASVPGKYEELSDCLRRFAEAYFNCAEADWPKLMSSYYMLIYLLQDFVFRAGSGDAAISAMDNDLRVRSLENYIHMHYKEALSLKDLATQFYLSPTYLSKYFTKNFGVNFYTYLQNVRLENAVRELLMEKSSIAKAALNNGFASLSSFNTVFKRKYGMQPAKYLKTYSQHQNSEAEEDGSGAVPLSYSSVADDLRIENEEQKLRNSIRTKNASEYVGETGKSEAIAITHPWRELINLDDASFCLNNEFQNQLVSAQKVLRFKRARVSGIVEILVRGDPTQVDVGSLNFSDFNRIINFLLSAGVKPFFELSSKPKKQDTRPDGFYFGSVKRLAFNEAAWEKFIRNLIVHCVNYWGANEVASWGFELWIYQTETLAVTDATIKEYQKYFKIAYDTIKEIVPQAQVGGPGVNLGGLFIFDSTEQLMQLMHENDLHPDFISAYLYPGCDAECTYEGVRQRLTIKTIINSDEDTNKNKIRSLQKTVKKYYPDAPVYITEFSSDALSRSTVNETCYKSAFIIKTVIDLMGEVDAMGYWQFSDLTQEHQDSKKIVFGGNGLISRHGIHKCGYFAFWFLSKLGDTMIDRGKKHIVTKNANGGYCVLVHNYKNLSDAYCTEYFKEDTMIPGEKLFDDVTPMHFKYAINGVNPGKYSVKKYTLNSYHGNLADMASELNCWEMARDEEIEYLTGASIPRQQIKYMECGDRLELETTLEPLEVVLFSIDRNFD